MSHQRAHQISGLHHVSIVSGDARRTIDFYTSVLGLRLVKQTVNFDDPTGYHLYFGDTLGRPGSLITFFVTPGAPQGAPGLGGTHHLALAVSDYDNLLKWKRRLTDAGIAVDGPLDRHYFVSIYVQDPDGTIVEIATQGPGWAIDEAPDRLGQEFREPPAAMLVNNRDRDRIAAEQWPDPVRAIDAGMALSHGLHHVTAIGADIRRTDAFFGELLGLRRVKMTSNFDEPTSAHWYWGVGDGAPGTLITYFERDATREARVRHGAGQTHHVAFTVPDDDALEAWRERLLGAAVPVSPVKDRHYFKSIYLRDPDGQVIELATAGPGFAIDEETEHLGASLKLPPWLEDQRTTIAAHLPPLERH